MKQVKDALGCAHAEKSAGRSGRNGVSLHTIRRMRAGCRVVNIDGAGIGYSLAVPAEANSLYLPMVFPSDEGIVKLSLAASIVDFGPFIQSAATSAGRNPLSASTIDARRIRVRPVGWFGPEKESRIGPHGDKSQRRRAVDLVSLLAGPLCIF